MRKRKDEKKKEVRRKIIEKGVGNQRSGKVWTTGERRGKIRAEEDVVRSQGQPQGQLSE